MSEFKHTQISAGFTIRCDLPKRYGIVIRGGKRFYRNYGRELKNGKGLTWLDILQKRHEDLYAELISTTAFTAFYTGAAT